MALIDKLTVGDLETLTQYGVDFDELQRGIVKPNIVAPILMITNPGMTIEDARAMKLSDAIAMLTEDDEGDDVSPEAGKPLQMNTPSHSSV